MFAEIAVPLDGSAAAQAIVPFGRRLGALCWARVNVVPVAPPAAALAGAGPGQGTGGASRPDGEIGLGVLAESSLDRLVVAVNHCRLDPSTDCLDAVTDSLLRAGRSPILLVRPDRALDLAPGRPHPLRVLVALDGTAADDAVIQPAIALALAASGHLTLVTVVTPGELPGFGVAERIRESQRYLDRVAERVRDAGVAVACRTVTSADIGDSLLDLLEQGRFDLGALGRRGVAAPEGELGRIAGQLIRCATKPLLVGLPT